MTKGSLCIYLSQDASHPSAEVPELHSNQKEADPRLALHAVYATARHTGTCVVADDTDVYILLIFVLTNVRSTFTSDRAPHHQRKE